jgi:hypothetical protein
MTPIIRLIARSGHRRLKVSTLCGAWHLIGGMQDGRCTGTWQKTKQ